MVIHSSAFAYHIISYHIISYYIVSYHIISYCMISVIMSERNIPREKERWALSDGDRIHKNSPFNHHILQSYREERRGREKGEKKEERGERREERRGERERNFR